ncbi:MAG: radical SAM protein [Elusimicrobiota bacterium]
MNIVICTTPIRPVPTTYPPFGSMAVIQSLRRAGYDPHFYDIDMFRPSMEEIEKFLVEHRPSVVGISAVVSTAYAYTKSLSLPIKRVLPGTRVIVGGNLASSAELLHRLAGVDFCVIGEGEVVAVNLMRVLEDCRRRPLDFERLARVRGITYIQPDGEMNFPGYEDALPPDEVFDADWGILERFSKPEHFITDPLERPDFHQDPRTREPHRRGKKMATLVTAKGCVGRCTFCHRWDKGFRAIPVDQIMRKIRMLMDRYNVGFITFSDENFGSDRRQARDFLREMKPLDILWQVGGVRVRSVDPNLLREMKEAGCVAVYYGAETGSPAILEVMEKKATLQDNLNAAKWTREAGLFTIHQLVLAMPGETDETVRETTEFLKTVTQDVYESPRSRISINYIQALPGTPVYEYARAKGLIGRSLDDEERYLLSISDIDAQDDTKTINFTDEDYLTVRSWRRRIVLEVMRHYHRHNTTPAPGFFTFLARLAKRRLFGKRAPSGGARDGARGKVIEDYGKGGYFNLSRDLGYDVIVAYFYPLRHMILAAWLLQDELRRLPLRVVAAHVRDWIGNRLSRRRRPPAQPVSLRKTMRELTPEPRSLTERSMQPLRDGR